jgi:hypothetical protein
MTTTVSSPTHLGVIVRVILLLSLLLTLLGEHKRKLLNTETDKLAKVNNRNGLVRTMAQVNNRSGLVRTMAQVNNRSGLVRTR